MESTQKKPLTILNLIVLVLIPLIMWRFYWYVGLNHDRTALLSFLLVASLIVFLAAMSISGKLRTINRKSIYSKYMIIFLVIVFASIINAALFWNQNISLTFRAGYTAFIVVYFYVLYYLNVSNDSVLKLIFFFGAIYLLLWVYAVSQAPAVVFGNLDEIYDDRGFARIANLKSIDLVYLLYFVSLVKVFTKNQRRKILWVAVLIISFFLILYSLTRMVILGALLVTIVYLLRKRPFFMVLSIAVVAAFYSFIINNTVISSLMELTTDEISRGSQSALRIVEYSSFLELYPFHFLTALFGNGAPHIASSYGIFEESLKTGLRFHRSDAGYVGLYVTYGLSSIILFFSLFIKVMKQKVSKDAMPFKLFIAFLFIINISAFEFFNCGIGFMIALYMLDRDNHSFQYTFSESVKIS